MPEVLSKIPISRRRTIDLVNTVVLPLIGKLDRAVEHARKDMRRESDYIRFLVEFAIAVVFLPDKKRAILKSFQPLMAPESPCFTALNQLWPEFVERLWAWVEHSELVPEEERSKLEKRIRDLPSLRVLLTELDHPESVEQVPEGHEGFWVEESAAGSEAINQLHTSDAQTQVVTAAEFLSDAGIDQERIEDLKEDIDVLNHLFDQYLAINEDFIAHFAQGLGRLASTLYSSYEFQALGGTLEQLIQLMKSLALSLSEEQKSILMLLLEQFVQDLSTWFEHVFQKQDAVDIHYLDAALLAALAQIEMLFTQDADAQTAQPADQSEDEFVMF